MERHNTHILSCSSSEQNEHSYKLDKMNEQSTKNISLEERPISKEEEKNDWSKIIINNYKEIKNKIGIDNDIKDIINKDINNDINDNIIDEKNIKEKEEEKPILKNEEIDIEKNILDEEENVLNDQINSFVEDTKIEEEKKSENEKKEEKKDKGEKEEKEKEKKKEKEKEKEKEEEEEKLRILNNGIVVIKVNQQKELQKNNSNKKEEKDNNDEKINNIDNTKVNIDYNTENIKPLIIKPNRSFITKEYIYKANKKSENFTKTTTEIKNKNTNIKNRSTINYSINQTTSVGNCNKITVKSRISSASSAYPKLNRQRPKSSYKPLLDRNKNSKKLDDKYSSISSITTKKNNMPNNTNLFISNTISKNNKFNNRPKSSYNIIKKEIDLNLKSSKIENSFYNQSYSIQKTCQISSIMNSKNIGNKYKMDSQSQIIFNNYKNKKEIIFDNKNFFNDLKELKNAFQLSDNNNNINNENLFSSRNNKIDYKNNSENFEKNLLALKRRKLNSAKVKGRSYNAFYSKDPSPLFIEFSKKNYFNENNNDNFCSKCGYKKHFGNEKNCPLCISLRENNKKREQQTTNLNYYYPFKNKNENNNSFQNSFRSNSSINSNNKNKQITKNDNFRKFIRVKMENLLPLDCYYNPFKINYMNNKIVKKKNIKDNLRVNSALDIGNYNDKIFNKYNALQKYFE